MIQVVCAIVFNEGKVLATRRLEGKKLGGYWEFPGGKIELNESEEIAIERELIEELGMRVDITERLGAFIHHYDGFSINLIGFRCEFRSWSGKMTDHDKLKWCEITDLKKLNFSEADLPFLNILNKI
jgi:8-oxo-dGTP diphosphatase